MVENVDSFQFTQPHFLYLLMAVHHYHNVPPNLHAIPFMYIIVVVVFLAAVDHKGLPTFDSWTKH